MTTMRKDNPYAVANALRRGTLTPEQVGVDQVVEMAAMIAGLTVTYGVRVVHDGVPCGVYWYPDAEIAYEAHRGMVEAAGPDVFIELVTTMRSDILGPDFLSRGPQGVQEIESH